MLRTNTGMQSLYINDGAVGSPIALITSDGYQAFGYDDDPYGVRTLTEDSGGAGVSQNPSTFASTEVQDLRQVRLRQIRRSAAQDLVLGIKEPVAAAKVTQLDTLSGCRSGRESVLDVSGFHRIRQTRFADPEITSHVSQSDTSVATPSDSSDVLLELTRIGLGHDAHPSSSTFRHHRSDVTYRCSSPLRNRRCADHQPFAHGKAAASSPGCSRLLERRTKPMSNTLRDGRSLRTFRIARA